MSFAFEALIRSYLMQSVLEGMLVLPDKLQFALRQKQKSHIAFQFCLKYLCLLNKRMNKTKNPGLSLLLGFTH